MPRFTFIVRSAGEESDQISLDLRDAEAAYLEAIRACAEMARDCGSITLDPHASEIEVLSDTGERVCVARFSSSTSRAN